MKNFENEESIYEWLLRTRPKWWFINPWLYIKRRDKAYASTLETIQELSISANPINATN